MFEIFDKQELAAGVFRYVVKAPEIAAKACAGQFVILRLNEHGERIPITIADSAREEEIGHGREEGIEYQRMRLAESDESGRKKPVPIEGSEFELQADAVIIALGSGTNPLIAQNTEDLKTDAHGHIELSDADFQMTFKQGVFAGGDIVTGAATVISAMGAGKKAALGIHNYVMNK